MEWIKALHPAHKTAVFWIRDGVLIDRMPVNAVAFAVASLTYADSKYSSAVDLTSLINFAFKTSGISCAEKMTRFNRDNCPLITDVSAAARYYNAIAGQAASHCHYIDGACQLVARLKDLNMLNFITSAVEQKLLDAWASSEQAQPLMPYLTEILGSRSEAFSKGRGHFQHARSHYGVDKIIYVADAQAEISNGVQLAQEFNILTVGLAHFISREKVRHAFDLVLAAHQDCFAQTPSGKAGANLTLDESRLDMPDQSTLAQSLEEAQASYVVSGDDETIMANLGRLLKRGKLLQM